MAKTYDASSKSLVTQFPEDIAALVGVTGVPVRELNSDSSDVIPVSGAVDGNLVVGTKKPFLLHVEFQAAHKAKLPKREYVHSAVLGHKYNMAVRTVIFYLHPEAWRRSQNGHYVIKDGFGWVCNQFNYQVVKVWTLKPNDLLKRVGTIPLAPLADITSDQLPALLTAIDRRLESESAEIRDRIAATTYVLAGLKFELKWLEELIRRHPAMRESVTYQAILKEGREEGREEGRVEGREEGRVEGREEGREVGREEALRASVLRVATHRLGKPDAKSQAKLDAIHDPAVLECLLDRAIDTSSWKALFRR